MKFNLLLPNVEISGGNRANFELANALCEQGHEVRIFYPVIPGRDGLGWSNVRKTLVQIVKGVRNSVTHQSWFELNAELTAVRYFSTKQLQKNLPEADYLIVSWWAHVEFAISLAEKHGRPLHLIRSLEYWGGPESSVTHAYEQDLIKLVTSNSLKAQYESRFGLVDGIVPDGVSIELFQSEASPPQLKSKVAETDITIGLMYRRQPLKRMPDAIKVLATICDRYPQVRCVLFGEKLKRDDRVALRAISRCEHVLFPTGEKLRDIYRCLDIFLFPSGPEEAFGLPPLEAMACGCAVVSTRVGAVDYYSTDRETALLCDVGDIDGMTELVDELVQNSSLREELSDRARTHVQVFGWDRSARQLIEVLTTA